MHFPIANLGAGVLALPPLYLALWGMLLALTAALVVLVRTEWGRERPTHRYVLLSIVAHLALICLATTVRFWSAPAGEESASPISVRIVMRAPAAAPEEVIDEAPPTPVVEPIEQPVPETEPVETIDPQPSAEPPSDPVTPPTPAEPEPSPPSPKPAPAAEATTSKPEPRIQSPPTAAEPPPLPQRVATAVPPPFPSTPTEPVVADQPITPYAARRIDQRLKIVEKEGGSRATEDAVAAALDWLASAQSRDGRWDADRWSAGRETRTLGHNRYGAGAGADTGVTGLALLALLGAGHSQLDGPYAENVDAGLAYLLRTQAQDGGLAGDAALFAQTYCHSMATFALAEALANTDDRRLANSVRRAVDFLVARQDRAGGGWRYTPGASGDMSQMGWIIMALRSAELAGIDSPPVVWSSIERFVRSTRRGDNGGLSSYQPRGPVSRTMTAESLYCRQILGWPTARSPAADAAVNHVLGRLPGQGKANLYFWYYATLALHHHRSADPDAHRAWRVWNEAMSRTLVSTQVPTGPTAGSWSPNTLWGGYGGRVYSTAMAAMCLEVYYRYDADEVARDPWVAARPAPRLR